MPSDIPKPRTAFIIFSLVGFASLILARLPNVVAQGGRLWAEEGRVYLANAWHLPWWQAWFAIHTGYINFAAGFGTWLALNLGGLMYAPLFATSFALCIQCIPIFVVLTHDFPWSGKPPYTLAAVIACALLPGTSEVWLNTITSQFWLAFAASLIFAAPARGRLRFFDYAVLALAVLSGPATSFLMPLFLLRAVRTRRSEEILHAVILFVGCALQAAIYIAHWMPERSNHLVPTELASILALHVVVLDFLGLGIASRFSAYLAALYAHAGQLWAGPTILAFCYGGLAYGIWRTRDSRLLCMMMAALIIGSVSFYEALEGVFPKMLNVIYGGRYAFVPMALTSLTVIGVAASLIGRPRVLFVALTILLLAVGAGDYRSQTGFFDNGPAWKPQVIRWKSDPRTTLEIWPVSWSMKLSPHS